MDGLEFLKTVRDSDNDTPVIIFTGKGREEIAIKAYELGADHYLQKGRDTKSLFYEIIQKINISVEKKQIQRDLDVSRKLYANIFHHLPDPTFVIDSFREMPNPGVLEFFSFMNRGSSQRFAPSG